MVGVLCRLTTGDVKIVCISGKGSLLRELDQKPGDLTMADQQQVDYLTKAAVERKLKKVANWLTAEERLKILMSSKEPSLNYIRHPEF